MTQPEGHTQRQIIGLGGGKHAGKSETSKRIQQLYPDRAMELALPEPIYRACMEIFGWTYDQCTDPVLREMIDERYGVSPRYAQQTLGTEWGRQQIHDQLWILRAQQRLEATASDAVIIVPNIRFDNEAAWIKSEGGHIFYVHRPGYEPDGSHVSEVGLPESWIDAYIYNLGTGPDWQDILNDQVDFLITHHISPEDT